ncbi:MAG TPA: response regulator transcription factor [Puia sp.]|jgi:DNA-binding NarL/FixJ family response regulator|nr:response regulator transcription factor [Puia sp.]
MPVKVAFVDDNMVNRNTFARKIQNFDDLEIVFIAPNGNTCLEELKELSPEKMPQVLFVDLQMPNMSGIQLIQIAKTLYPSLHFIVLTVFDDDERIFEAIKAGANGYLLKDDNAISLRNAITNSLEQGGAPMSPSIARKALDILSKASVTSVRSDSSESSLDSLLSEREKEILQHTIKGYSPKQIADTLFISIYTVRKHIANIYEKLHVNSNTQVMNLAYKNKWI